jgi:hypothetical protein
VVEKGLAPATRNWAEKRGTTVRVRKDMFCVFKILVLLCLWKDLN